MPQLARIRHERRLTQLQLARRIGRSRALVSLWERGYTPRNDAEIEVVGAALGVSPAILSAKVIEVVAGDRGGFLIRARKGEGGCCKQ